MTKQTHYRWRRKFGGLKISHAERLRELELKNSQVKRLVASQALDISRLKKATSGNFETRKRYRDAVDGVQEKPDVPERRACRVLDPPKSTRWARLRSSDGRVRSCNRIIELARAFGRNGYSRVTTLIRAEG